jgi:hypothetical protein
MTKSTKTLLLVGGIAAAIYYFSKNSAGAAANQETPAELLASTNATIAAQLNAMNAAQGV